MILPGIGGWLLPTRFLAERVGPAADSHLRDQPRWERWWRDVARACGPATGVRTLFDVAAMPLFGRLGFRARHPRFLPGAATASLFTPGGQTIALIVRPWATRPPALWREATTAARDVGARWCCVFAPPTLSIIPASGHAQRRSLDITWPDATSPSSLSVLLSLASAAAFDALALEHLIDDAVGAHARVRADLQEGVMATLDSFEGLLTQARHQRTRPADAARDEALTLVYRILFLLFAESRDLVPHHHPVYRQRYALTSLCKEALAVEPARGLWEGLAAVSRLSRSGGRVDALEVFPFNGHLFSSRAAPALEATIGRGRPTRDSDRRDTVVGRALIALGTRREPAGRVAISYADLGVEELGAIYERVLDADEPNRAVKTSPRRHSVRRKETGTFYTPQALADFVVHRTLAPLVCGRSADHLLELRVLDPAMGSGAFLVAALRYLTTAYERALIHDGRCHQADISERDREGFRRLIAQHCLFGVDANPVAVQVARLSLWLATMAHTRPLGFFDHRLRVGNSLVGASPSDIQRSPGATTQVLPLFDTTGDQLQVMLRRVMPVMADLADRPDHSVTDVRRKEAAWAALQSDAHPLARWRNAVSLWCAQWFWPDREKRPSPAEIRSVAAAITRGHGDLRAAQVDRYVAIARRVADQQRCFHWPLEFPDVFYRTIPHSGFDAIVGNPPWEMIRRDESSSRRGSRRDPIVGFVRESGLFPLCQRGHLNLYQPFIERSLSLVRPGGRVGLIVPWGFAVDDGAGAIRSALVNAGALDTFVGLDNVRGLFPVHRGLRFGVMVASPGSPPHDTQAAFGLTTTRDIEALTAMADEPLPVRLSAEVITKVGGPSRRIPDLRELRDLEWLSRMMEAHPALGDQDGWLARFGRELNATEDREALSERRGRDSLPVAGGRHIGPFQVHVDHCTQFISSAEARQRLPHGPFLKPRLVYRDVSGVGNRFTLIAAVMPSGVVTTHTLLCLRGDWPADQLHFLCGLFNSARLNRLVRLLMGSHVTTSLVERLPVPCWTSTPAHQRIAAVARRLSEHALSARCRNRLIAELNSSVENIYGAE